MSLIIPFIVGAAGPSRSTYDFEPTHIASWTTRTAAGPSRYTALASPDNSIWIYPQAPNDADRRRQGKPRPDVPQVIETEPTPSETPVGRPGNPRLSSYSQRSRAPSVASSTRTSSSRHRVTSFSPPSTSQAVLTSLSPTTATATANDGHGRAHSLSERAELIEHLREQQARNSLETQGRSSVGLGINLGRKLDVQGQADHGRESGSTSPRSVKSDYSGSTTIGGRLMEWAKGSEDGDTKSRRELSDQVAEIAVEREMQKETAEDAKQEEERKVIDAAMAKCSPSQSRGSHTPPIEQETPARRIILREPGRGRIVSFKVFEKPSLLFILRDNGLLDIFRTDTLAEYAALDLEEPEQRRAASSSKTLLRLSLFWLWQDLHILSKDNENLLIAEGLPWSCGMPSHNGDVTQVVMMSVHSTDGVRVENRLELPGQGPIGVCCPAEEPILLHTTSSSMTSYRINLRSRHTSDQPERPSTPGFKPQNRAVSSADPSPRLGPSSKMTEGEQPLLRKHQSFASLRDAQAQTPTEEKGFAKYLAAKKADWRGERKAEDIPVSQAGVELGPGTEVERNGGGGWRRFEIHDNGDGLGLVDDAVEIFTYNGSTLHVKGTITLEQGIAAQHVLFSPAFNQIVVIAKDKMSTYEGKSSSTSEDITTILRDTIKNTSAAACMSRDDMLLPVAEGIRRIPIGEGSDKVDIVIRRVAKTQDTGRVVVPSSTGNVWSADPAGSVSRRPFIDLIKGSPSSSGDDTSMDRLDSPITCMKVIGGEKRFLVAGDEDGAVRIWDEKSGHLQGSWTLFADPVDNLTVVDMPGTALHDHLLCSSREGTIGVISLLEMDQVYLIPASRAPLRRIFVGGKDVLLAYANGKARVWNVETMEFRRSTGIDAADEMLQAGKWSEIMPIVSESTTTSGLASRSGPIGSESDTGCIMSLDPAKLFSEAKGLPTSQGLDVIRGMLAVFLPFGLDDSIDRVCTDKLAIPRPRDPISIGNTHAHGSVELVYASSENIWYSTPEQTGIRQLMIIALLRPFLEHEEYERYAAEVIAYYTASLPDDIVQAGLDYFASFYLNSSPEIQHAARMLFDSALDRMTEQDLQDLIEQHQPHLVLGQSSDEEVGQALLIIGGIGLHKYQSMTPTVLKAVSETILRILHDPSSPHLALAIELCSRGFTTWQSYVDPMELLRRLFHLSTRKDSSSSSAHARLAVLHVASSNPALFMSTLSMDILDAKSAEGRTSIMKLCVYMARKKPEVLENGLPRIAEAVVKSLDPNIAKMRDDVWQAATVILNELVLAFSTIDFHSGTQKLAVGTHEGAVIMYELKTASRLYVLEPHRAPVSSVTFSPDGRRLLTVSLEEGVVTVWKVGSSLSGFFNVGGPPRQGGLGGSGPFKRIEFARVEDAPLKSTSALSDVRVSWPGSRQAKVEIGETAMSFET